MTIDSVKAFLKEYDGEDMRIMEVCGSHTAAIASCGIRDMLSDRIHLISGPGCPVCVTPSSYIDKLIELSLKPGYCVVTFGDIMRVPGSRESLLDARSRGAEVVMVYSPLDCIDIAEKSPEKIFVFAAVGFETTAPVYAQLIDRVIKAGIENIHILTAIKTMPAVIGRIMENGAPIDGFLAPGHVSVITGYDAFSDIARVYAIPFVVAGFTGERLLVALFDLVKNRGRGLVKNDYPSVVTREGNLKAKELTDKYFKPCGAVWRGLGKIKGSGLILREEYSHLDEGSVFLDEDIKLNKACICDRVLTGSKNPAECPLFGRGCTPSSPQGACMVSREGSCFTHFVNDIRGK